MARNEEKFNRVWNKLTPEEQRAEMGFVGPDSEKEVHATNVAKAIARIAEGHFEAALGVGKAPLLIQTDWRFAYEVAEQERGGKPGVVIAARDLPLLRYSPCPARGDGALIISRFTERA